MHGRLEQRSISVLTPPHGLVNYPGVRQIAPCHPLPGAAEQKPRRHREGRERLHRDRLPHHLPRCRGRVGARAAAAQSRPLGGGKPEPSTERLRLRRGRLPDPHGPRPGEPGQPQQHRARGDLRQPPRGGEPRRNPAPAAARPQRGHRRPDTALRRHSVRDPPQSRQTSRTNHPGPETVPVSARGRPRSHAIRPEHANSASVRQSPERSATAWESPGGGGRRIGRGTGRVGHGRSGGHRDRRGLPRNGIQRRRPALPYEEVAKCTAKVRGIPRGSESSMLALEFLVLTACPFGRSAQGDLGGDRPWQGDVDGVDRAHEGEPRAPRTAVEVRAGSARGGGGLERRVRTGVSGHPTSTTRESAFRCIRRESGHILPRSSRHESDQGNLIMSSNLCDDFRSTARER